MSLHNEQLNLLTNLSHVNSGKMRNKNILLLYPPHSDRERRRTLVKFVEHNFHPYVHVLLDDESILLPGRSD